MKLKLVPKDRIKLSSRGRRGKYTEDIKELRDFFTSGDYKEYAAQIYFTQRKDLESFRQAVFKYMKDFDIRTRIEKLSKKQGDNLIIYKD